MGVGKLRQKRDEHATSVGQAGAVASRGGSSGQGAAASRGQGSEGFGGGASGGVLWGGVSGLGMSRSCDVRADISSALVQSAGSVPRVCPSLRRLSGQAGCLSHTPRFARPSLQAVPRSVHPSIPHGSLSICPPPHPAPSFSCPFLQGAVLSAHPPMHPDPSAPPRAMPRVCLSVHALGALSIWPCTMLHAPLPAMLHPVCLSPPGLPCLSFPPVLRSVRQSPHASLHPVRLSPRNTPSVLPLPMFGGRHALCLTHVPSSSGRD